jgi:hypothetical protein
MLQIPTIVLAGNADAENKRLASQDSIADSEDV